MSTTHHLPSPSGSGIHTALQAELQHLVAAGHCPGALAWVERQGQIQARLSIGLVAPGMATPMNESVRFRLASLTKPVVTTAAMMLVDQGRLALDAPVAEWLPVLGGLRLADGSAPRRPPSVRDLMRHTSGLAYPFEVPEAAVRAQLLQAGFSAALAGQDSAAFLQRLSRLPLVAEPGTRFRYGYSTDVLGAIVEAVSGMPLGQCLREQLFEPLGMAHTGFELDPDLPADQMALAHAGDAAWHALIPPIGQRQPGAPWMDSGGGGLIGTLADYAAFARLLANQGRLGDRQLVSAAAIDTMFSQQLPDGVDGPGSYCGPGFGFGLGLALRQDFGPAAMPCSSGEGVWSGISGTALFVQPRTGWFALLFSANMATRMITRMNFRHALGQAASVH